jgi:ribosomal protein S18 acetylase RimI-like enzyme
VVGHEHPDVPALRRSLDAEVAGRYADQPGFAASAPADAPGAQDALLVAYLAGAPVALAGLRALDSQISEIKHVYVAPGARRRGIASRLLDELEELARERGYLALRLDTGARQHEAVALYRARGFDEIAAYNSNVGVDVWMEKRLGPEPGR